MYQKIAVTKFTMRKITITNSKIDEDDDYNTESSPDTQKEYHDSL